MSYITHKLKNIKINYENKFNLIKEKNYYKIENGDNIEELVILINEDTYLPVDSVNSYLIERHYMGKENSNFECRALRLYFDFLEAMELEWDEGSEYSHKRPLSMFSKFLTEQFKDNEMSGTTAVNYFNSVCRFYKYHLSYGHKFKGMPVSFKKRIIEVHSNSLTNHINKYDIEIEVADCRPKIPTQSKSTDLIPFNEENYKFLFSQINIHSTRDMALICLLAANTGLRAGEIADLRIDMINSYNGEDVFDLYVGPQIRHKTKNNRNGIIKVSGKIIKILLKHLKTKNYLKRLSKYEGDRPYVFLTNRGGQFTQQTISVLFSTFIKNNVKPYVSSFNHKFHDLRVTFGVTTMRACLRSDMEKDEALSYVQDQMRHKHIETTMQYLEYWTHSVVVKKKIEMQESVLMSVYDMLDSKKDL